MNHALRIIFWELTKHCNLKCSYCRVTSDHSCQELSTSEALGLVRKIKKEFKNVLLILSGGEACLRKDLSLILKEAQQVNLRVSLATNGTLITEKEVAMIKKYNVQRVSISLDSVNEKKHDASRGVAGAYQKAMESIALFKNERIPFQINFTLTTQNIEELMPVYELAKELGACALHYFVVVAVGCGRALTAEQMLSPHQIQSALKMIKKISEMSSMEIKETCAPQHVRLNPQQNKGGCLAGRSVMFISSEGNIFPCGYLPVSTGSIRQTSIEDIWRESDVFSSLRKDALKGMCGECGYQEKCRGCRARAFSKTGDFMDEDDSCYFSEVAKNKNIQKGLGVC